MNRRDTIRFPLPFIAAACVAASSVAGWHGKPGPAFWLLVVACVLAGAFLATERPEP